jgi:serine/threonine-protein kinase
MGRTYRRLGVFDRAQALLEQALDSGRRVFGPEHVRVAQTLHDLGVVRGDRGDYDAAARTLEEALAMRRKLLGAENPDVAVTLAELGRVYQDQGFNRGRSRSSARRCGSGGRRSARRTARPR